ncbi:PilZ domain-containing protein [Dongia mobilis]|uniref:PilZ domain-containing protein n=1 Tax=Dongia sp. TaxID=1977262 RepID=UPI0026EF6DDC
MISFTLGFRKVGKVEMRRDKRFFEPTLSVEIDDYRYDTENWSLGGLLLRNYDGRFFSNMLVLVHIKVKGDTRDQRVQSVVSVEARVVRNDRQKRLLALKFVKLTPAAIRFLERSYLAHRNRVR